jgi:hypothetical protein
MGSQDPSKPREGKTEIKDKAGPGRELTEGRPQLFRIAWERGRRG